MGSLVYVLDLEFYSRVIEKYLDRRTLVGLGRSC
jgi:hypothetical protein